MISEPPPRKRMLVKAHFCGLVHLDLQELLQVEDSPGHSAWFVVPVAGCFSGVMFVLFMFYTTLAEHSETSKIAVTTFPQDITKQMDPWTSLPSVPIP